MPVDPRKDYTQEITDTRPMAMTRTISQAATAIAIVIYVIYHIMYCGCV